jgi:hypothetical protein
MSSCGADGAGALAGALAFAGACGGAAATLGEESLGACDR